MRRDARRFPSPPLPEDGQIELQHLSDLAQAVDDRNVDRVGLDVDEPLGNVGNEPLDAEPGAGHRDQTRFEVETLGDVDHRCDHVASLRFDEHLDADLKRHHDAVTAKAIEGLDGAQRQTVRLDPEAAPLIDRRASRRFRQEPLDRAADQLS